MVSAEHRPDPVEMTYTVGDLTIEMAGMSVGVDRVETTDAVIVELYHPLLAELPPPDAEDVVAAVMQEVLNESSVARSRISATRARQPPQQPLSLVELRLLLDYLDP